MSFYESPLFVELLLDAIYLLLTVAAGLTAWSVVRTMRLRAAAPADDLVPTGRIAWGVALLLALTLGLTALLADTTPLTTNGRTYDDTFWLRTSDMLINTSGVLMAVAVACLIISMLWKKK